MKIIKGFLFSLLSVIFLFISYAEIIVAQNNTMIQLKELSIEALMNVQVSSVSRKKQTLAESAAAVYVITQEDIRRSGLQTIPEILRMAPGLHVAQIDSSKWAVTSRGFNGRFANKLLVLMDGRTIYSPLFSGVYWDVQDLVLEDIERIEIIRGPGATMWGANAVNGVINIISKSTFDTQSGLFTLSSGTNEKYASTIRFGGEMDDNSSYRIYAKRFKRHGGIYFQNDNEVADIWTNNHTGFRFDSTLTQSDSLSIQGDIYSGSAEQNIYQPISRNSAIVIKDRADTQGSNILFNWDHRRSENSGMVLKLYFDQSKRKNKTLKEKRNTFDIDFQNDFLISGQKIIWGLSYRQSNDYLDEPEFSPLTYSPDNRKNKTISAFVQDDIRFYDDKLHLIIGSKFEHNGYTGNEWQPNIRFIWLPNKQSSIWASVAKAVRVPSRLESDVEIQTGGPITVYGSKYFTSEELLAYELGYRFYPQHTMSIDIAGFINQYDELLTFELDNSIIPPVNMYVDNKMKGKTYGIEITANWEIIPQWRLNYSYSWLKTSFDLDSDSLDFTAIKAVNNTPEQQMQLRSHWNLLTNTEFDAVLYYVGKIPDSAINAFTRFDLRLGWQLNKNLHSSIAIQNLFDDKHPEFLEYSGHSISGNQGLISTQMERNLYFNLVWQY
jgi:iron complex outermembrane receptor protein